MTILLLSERYELDDNVSRHLRAWKAWHTTLYILTAVFGIANSAFLFQIESLVADRCVLYPKELEFHWVELPNITLNGNLTNIVTEEDLVILEENGSDVSGLGDATKSNRTVRQSPISESDNTTATSVENKIGMTLDSTTTSATENEDNIPENDNGTTLMTRTEVNVTNKHGLITNKTHAFVLNPDRSLFQMDSDPGCQFAEYMPLLSATFAIVWATLFIMCPSGGRASSFHQPWRILTPALVFAFVMLALTGFSFTSTNGGLTAFCAAFQEHTKTTACAPVNNYLLKSWNSSFTIGHRIAATRATSAGVWACWAVICAVLVARCLAAPDFVLKRTAVSIVKDPSEKLTPYLKKQTSQTRRPPSSNGSPFKRDNISIKSEPTNTTELVSASMEHEADSQPTSLATTPLKERPGEGIEMTYTYHPQEQEYR